ncbi:MAG: AMP-binding protein [Acidimicrobiales bacterium]
MAVLQLADERAGFVDVTTVGDCVDRAAHRWPGAEAMVFPDERATFTDLAARSDLFARAFIGLGISPGEMIGIRMDQRLDYYAALVGAAKIGAVAVPVNVRFKAFELAHVIVNSDMVALVGSPDGGEVGDHLDLISAALPSLAEAAGPELALAEAPRLRHVIVVGEATRPWVVGDSALWDAAAAVDDETLAARRLGVRVRDTAVLMYTSGTTDTPKGAMLSHEALVREGVVVGRTRFALTADDVLWTPLPLYHIGGIAFAFACWAVGATYCHNGHFDPAVAVRQLRDEGATVAIPAFEMLWMAIVDHPEFSVDDVPRLRLVFNVGTPERLRQLQEKVPTAVQVSGFGATEASSFMTLGEIDDSLEDRVNTIGRPLPGLQVRIVDPETGEDCEPGVVGEICYRGWSTFDGYYKDPERNAEVFDEAGFFHSGDLGKLDGNGRFVFAGRLKDMMKVGGENVAAAEVEGFLLRHAAVAVAQVVAAPDARYDQVPTAFVQLVDGAEVTEEDIIAFCLGSIATYKVPRYVRFVDDWPMSGTKVKKFVLAERIEAELAAAGITEAPKLHSRPTPER